MRSDTDLQEVLSRIDGRGYKAYKELEGQWVLDEFIVHIDHVQADPFASPSRLRVILDSKTAGLPHDSYHSTARALGTGALLARSFAETARGRSKRRGTGGSGEIRMEHPGQIVLPQTAVMVSSDGSVEARFGVGLPARGRRVAAGEAGSMLLEDCLGLIRDSLQGSAHDATTLERHAAANEDATVLRETITNQGLFGFVAEGALLPRRSGIDDRPLQSTEVVTFVSPESLRVEVDLPNAGRVKGMGIPEGVTLIVGGGYHGKSTLLRALQSGVYNHPPGDGRELVVAREDAVKIRAEDGRFVCGVDISPFIDGLPMDQDTRAFSTLNASGSTSQAAAIVEALEAGAGALLVDEDTSATNFMIRDRRMQELVPKDAEPITPFVDRVTSLHRDRAVSTVLVLGGSGDYLDVADLVLRMKDYRPEDVTRQAREVAESFPTGRVPEGTSGSFPVSSRRIRRSSVDPRKGKRPVFVRAPHVDTIALGVETIDLASAEQLVHRGQTRALALALARVASMDGGDSVAVDDLLDQIERLIEREGLDGLDQRLFGDLTGFRRHELAMALNRLRSLRVD
jgi:predicted ABC-class ATPase